MPVITVIEPFKFSADGIAVTEYEKGDHDVSDRCAEVALENKWATKAEPAPANKGGGKAKAKGEEPPPVA